MKKIGIIKEFFEEKLTWIRWVFLGLLFITSTASVLDSSRGSFWITLCIALGIAVILTTIPFKKVSVVLSRLLKSKVVALFFVLMCFLVIVYRYNTRTIDDWATNALKTPINGQDYQPLLSVYGWMYLFASGGVFAIVFALMQLITSVRKEKFIREDHKDEKDNELLTRFSEEIQPNSKLVLNTLKQLQPKRKIEIWIDLYKDRLILEGTPQIRLYGADFRGINFSGVTENTKKFLGINLEGADLEEANLVGLNLSNSHLSGVNLKGADLKKVDLTSANLSVREVTDAHEEPILLRAILSSTQLRAASSIKGIKLSGLDLSKFDLQGKDLTGGNLRYATLQGIYLQGAVLRGVTVSANALRNSHHLKGTTLPNGHVNQHYDLDFNHGVPWTKLGYYDPETKPSQ